MSDKMNLYRGTKQFTSNGPVINHYLKEPRKPLDSEPFVHDIADQWFESMFGIKARSQTIFCTPNEGFAREYKGEAGSLLRIELSEESVYSLIFSPLVYDFLKITEQISDLSDEQKIKDWLTDKNYKRVENIEDIPEDFEGEIMLYCEEYEVKNI